MMGAETLNPLPDTLLSRAGSNDDVRHHLHTGPGALAREGTRKGRCTEDSMRCAAVRYVTSSAPAPQGLWQSLHVAAAGAPGGPGGAWGRALKKVCRRTNVAPRSSRCCLEPPSTVQAAAAMVRLHICTPQTLLRLSA